MPGNWDFYEVHQVPEKAHYTWPLMSNAQNDTFSLNMIEHYGQRIKTKTEIIRYASSFPCAANLTVTRAKIVPYTGVRETYSMEEFMDYEFRSGERNLALEVTFHPQDGSYCLNRDVMSFLMTGLQHFFTEYECIGMLI